ncbi:MAG TPA: carboxypeptidase regulatory-like domain-containing protein [Bryobacteraceae bacterium]|nr:carboxypeptidase regulatory-like domain-containing protein [Bryobacteraceae bacterium]
MSQTKVLIFVVIMLFAFSATAHSQTTFATITGTVTDATGAVVPGATVTATNVATNIKATTQSNEAGNYTIAQLKEGTYSVRGEAAGFMSFVVDSVALVSRDVRRVDIRLEVGAVETAVEVKGGATLIETETARITSTKTTLELNTLPTNSRGLWAYLNLAPGLQGQDGSSVTRFAGSRVNENNWSIDGTTFSDGVDNTQTGPLANYIESFQEVKIDLSNNSAEFGSVGQVTIISKSGTNDLHGALFDYYSTPWFRAKCFFCSSRGTGIRHAPGGAAGGPVWLPKIYDGRNRTFFYFSYETARGSAVSQVLNPMVAPSAWRNGDFSNLSTPIIDPTTGQPFEGNKIPEDRINSVSKKIQDKFFPLPNYGDLVNLHSQNYRELRVRAYDPSTYWTTRIDHKVRDGDQIFGRYTWSRLYNRPWEGNLPTIGLRWQQRDDRAATTSWTHSFRPTLLNEFRWGFGLNNNPINYDFGKGSTQHGVDLVKELGLVGLAPDLPDINGILNITFNNGMTGLYQYPWRKKGYRTHTEEIQDHVSWFKGRHNLKFGFYLLRAEYDDFGASGNLFGNVRFTDRFTGQPYADFLLGLPTTASRAFPPVEVARNRWSYDFFATDDFKLSPKLTVNVGVRYELHLNWRENNGLMSLFDIKSGKLIVPDGALSKVSAIFPKDYVGVAEASSVGWEPQTLVRQDKNNIAPRIGLAYRPWGNDTVFRAGFGMFYNVVPFVYVLNFGDVPFLLAEPSYNNPKDNPQVIFPRVFPSTGTGGPSEVSLSAAENPDYRTPYSLQYNFTIERQQWNTGFRLSYIGTAMRKGPWQYNYNAPVANDQPFISKGRAFQNYPEIWYVTNGAGHQYNGLTAEALRHLAGGLYFQGSWTWARDRYDLDYNWDFGGEKFISEDPRNRKREIGPAQEIPTHRFSTNFIYQLPFGKGRHFGSNVSRLGDLLIGGWELSGIYTAQTGQFLTPFWSGDDPVGISFTDSDTPASVTLRPDVLRNPNFSSGQRTIEKWFDTGAFAPPQAGSFGTSGKGVIIGPGVNVWSVGFAKEFGLYERARLRWEMTATNFFNHPNWVNPSTDITDSSVGEITSDGGVTSGSVGDRAGSRNFRMGLRLQF